MGWGAVVIKSMQLLGNIIPKAYSEPCQTSKMERFAKIVNRFHPLTFFGKRSNLDA